jgi:hypothetical protein
VDRYGFDTDPVTDRHQNGNSDTDRHQNDADPQHLLTDIGDVSLADVFMISDLQNLLIPSRFFLSVLSGFLIHTLSPKLKSRYEASSIPGTECGIEWLSYISWWAGTTTLRLLSS